MVADESGSALLGSCTTLIVVILNLCASKGGYLNEALDDLGAAAALSNAQPLKGFPRAGWQVNCLSFQNHSGPGYDALAASASNADWLMHGGLLVPLQ